MYASANADVTVIVPLMFPFLGWWPLLKALSSHSVLVAEKGPPDMLLLNSKDGFIPGSSPYSLLEFRIRKKNVYILTGETFSLFSLCRWYPNFSSHLCHARLVPNPMILIFAIVRDVLISAKQGHIKRLIVTRPLSSCVRYGSERRLWLLGNRPLLIKNREGL